MPILKSYNTITYLWKHDGVGLCQHFGPEHAFDLADDHVHTKGVFLQGTKAVNCKLGDFACLNQVVVVCALGENGQHVALVDKNLHDSGVDLFCV